MFRGPSDSEMDNVIGQMLADMGEPDDSEDALMAGVMELEGPLSPGLLRPLERCPTPVTMLAVDGGSAGILDAGSFMVAAVRVGHAAYRGREHAAGDNAEMHLLHLASGHLSKAYEIFFRKYVGNAPPDMPRGLPEAVGRIRALMEWHRVDELLRTPEECPEGAVLAVDGALWAGINGLEPLLARLSDTARRRNVLLCGISKRSMLTHRSRPLIPAVQKMGDGAMPGVGWLYPVRKAGYRGKLFGEVYVARLHPGSGYAFRVDLCLPSGVSPDKALGMLAYHADDPGYVGYPYPLARAHNDVAFSRAEVGDLRGMLREKALAAGMGQEEWQLTFQDFHELLDTGR